LDWEYQGGSLSEIDLEEWIGFVYIIENKLNNRKYVGQKLLWFATTKYKKNPKTGKRKKIKGRKVSDWQTYYGSSEHLKADVAIMGADNFSRTILKFCKATGELTYEELKEQMYRKVLESDEYYNGIIQVKIHKSHVPKPKTEIVNEE
jgi:hypothetical protein